MYLLFDIGGTKTRMALSKDLKTLERVQTFDTSKKFRSGIKLFQDYISAAGKIKPRAAAGGIRGPLNKDRTKTLDRLKLKDWNGKPLVKSLTQALKTKVYLENDADLAGLGEAVRGAGKGKKIVVYVTVSTGVGGVRIVNGRIDANVYGFEPGKQIINFDSRRQTLEDYVSGLGVERFEKKNIEKVSSRKFWQEKARILALGLSNMALHWSPEVIILGGGVMNDLDLGTVRKYFEQVNISEAAPELHRSQLGDKAGLYGALVLIKQRP